jgi:hypothetical protein
MKNKLKAPKKFYVYEAPAAFVIVFYGIIAAWSGVSVYLIGTKALSANWPVGQLAMVGFIIAYTWYWCLGISYRIEVSEEGGIELKSLRRVLRLEPGDVTVVEGPRLSFIPTVFVRFRLAREKAYLFCVISSSDLSEVLRSMHRNNRDLAFKGLAGAV